MLVVTGRVWLLTTQAAEAFCVFKCVFMNNSYDSFHTTLVSDLIENYKNCKQIKSNQTVSQTYYSRILQNCPTETDFKTLSPWVRMGDFLYLRIMMCISIPL